MIWKGRSLEKMHVSQAYLAVSLETPGYSDWMIDKSRRNHFFPFGFPPFFLLLESKEHGLVLDLDGPVSDLMLTRILMDQGDRDMS